MSEQAPPTNRIAALHEPLRRLDAVLNFARRATAEGGSVPDGLLEDFVENRREVEREFVRCFELLDLDALQAFRNFLQATRDINQRKLEKNVHKLARRTRSLLNRILIAESKAPGHASEVGAVRFHDHDPPHAPKPKSADSRKPSRSLRRVLVAMVLIAALAAIGLAAAWLAGAFSVPIDYTPIVVANDEPRDTPPLVTPADTVKPFDAAAEGYASAPVANVPVRGIDPLGDAAPTAENLPALLLGLEELVHALEPARLHATPAQTKAAWQAFAESVVAKEPAWRESRKPLLDAFTAHVKSELHLSRYPAETSAGTVLPSDVLYAAGGPQLPLIVSVLVLAECASLPTVAIAPNGPPRPELALRLPDRIDTWNGEALGLRTGNQPDLQLPDVLLELARLLRPTMKTPHGRVLSDALILRFAPAFTADGARAALADLDPRWLRNPTADAGEQMNQSHRLAVMLQPAVCRVLTAEGVTGSVDEAMKLYRLAQAAGDAPHANRAILLLGRRAEKGAMLDGEPLAYAVAELLAQQGDHAQATSWYLRAHEEHPDDPRATLRLAERAEGDARYALLREAYARGERAPAFLRQLAKAASLAGDGLLALAMLDELCSGTKFDAIDLENAVLQCIALERADWGQERLRKHTELAGSEPRLQRLDLILELSMNGLSERAKELAAKWRARGERDDYVKGLLERFGG